MSLVRNISVGLRSLFRKEQENRELDEELKSFLEMAAEEKIRRGMSRKEALRAVRLERGDLVTTKEVVHAARWESLLEACWRDLRFAGRVLRKSPGFTGASILTLALGIIGTTLVLTGYDALALKSLAVRDSKHLVVLERELRKGGTDSGFSEREYRTFRENNLVLDEVSAETGYETVLGQLPIMEKEQFSEPRRILIKLVSDNYFSALGVNAIAGRTLAQQAQNEAEPAAVLSFSSWQRRFRGDAKVVGHSLLISGTAVTIMGIAPRDFVGTGSPPVPPDFWLPLTTQKAIEPGRDWAKLAEEPRLRVIGRLKRDVNARQAGAELTTIAKQFEKDQGPEQTTTGIKADSPTYFIEKNNPQFQSLAILLMVSLGMVLLIACANLANYFLSRSTARRKEMAVRRALGASRGTLVRQLLTEGALIGVTAGTLTLMVAPLLCNLIWMEIQNRIVFRFSDLYLFTFRFAPDGWVLAWTMAVSVTAGILFSVLGAAYCTKEDSGEALRGHVVQWTANRGKLRVGARDVLIAAQVVFSVVLLVNAGLVARGMTRGQKVFPGFDTAQVIDMEFDNIENAGIDKAHTAALREQLVSRFIALPGVTGVAFADHVPLLGAGATKVSQPGKAEEQAFENQISPNFFSVFGIRVLQGRDFAVADAAGPAPVVIVTESTAQHLWPGESALGKIVRLGEAKTPTQVIGIVQDTRTVVLGKVEPLYLYLPAAANAPMDDVFVRTAGGGDSSVNSVLNAIANIDGRLASLASIHVMDDALWFQRLPSKIATLFATSIGSLGLFLASVGIYGTIVYAVTQRTREIGIRIAIGAQPGSILKLVLLRTMRMVGAATCLGLALAGVLSNGLTALPFGMGSLLLFGVSPWDPVVFSAVAAFLMAVSMLAAYLPARRATQVDPVVALRYE